MTHGITKLELIQLVLSRLNEEGVSSSGDTEEAEQVSLLVESAYYDILTMKNWSYFTKAGNLLTNPEDNNSMLIPYDLVSLHWFKYKNVELTEIKDWGQYINLKKDEPDDPKYYIVLGEVIYFDTIPEEGLISRNANIFYTREPKPIDTDEAYLDAPRRFVNVIRDQVLLLAYSSLHHNDAAIGLYSSLVKRGLVYLQKWQYQGSQAKGVGYGIDYSRK